MHIFKDGNFSQILTKYASTEKHSGLSVDHPVDHFYEALAMDYFYGLPCNWSSDRRGNVHFENLD